MRVLRVVTLGSSAGRYGGPFDTSIAQSRIVMAADPDVSVQVLAGHLPGDAPPGPGIPPGSAGPTVITRPVRRILPLPGFMALLSASFVRALWAGMDADVVHVSLSREAIPVIAVAMARLRRKRLIIQPHGMLTSRTSRAHKIVDMVLRPLARGAHVAVALTEVEAGQLRTWFRGPDPKIATIGNPVQAPTSIIGELRATARANEVVWIARLHPRKHVSTFVEAAGIADLRGWTERYVVVGPDEGDLPVVLEGIRTTRNLTYEGAVSGRDVPTRVARSKVFALTADSEPWGNVLVTALALGIPVALSASSALATLVAQYGAGVVIEDGDADALSMKIHALISDQDTYESASTAAQKLSADHLGDESVSRELLSIYSSRDPAIGAT